MKWTRTNIARAILNPLKNQPLKNQNTLNTKMSLQLKIKSFILQLSPQIFLFPSSLSPCGSESASESNRLSSNTPQMSSRRPTHRYKMLAIMAIPVAPTATQKLQSKSGLRDMTSAMTSAFTSRWLLAPNTLTATASSKTGNTQS